MPLMRNIISSLFISVLDIVRKEVGEEAEVSWACWTFQGIPFSVAPPSPI